MILSVLAREAHHVVVVSTNHDRAAAGTAIAKAADLAVAEFEESEWVAVDANAPVEVYLDGAGRAARIIADRWQRLQDTGEVDEQPVLVVLPLLENVLAAADAQVRAQLRALTVEQFDNASEVGVSFIVGANLPEDEDPVHLPAERSGEGDATAVGHLVFDDQAEGPADVAVGISELLRGDFLNDDVDVEPSSCGNGCACQG